MSESRSGNSGHEASTLRGPTLVSTATTRLRPDSLDEFPSELLDLFPSEQAEGASDTADDNGLLQLGPAPISEMAEAATPPLVWQRRRLRIASTINAAMVRYRMRAITVMSHSTALVRGVVDACTPASGLRLRIYIQAAPLNISGEMERATTAVRRIVGKVRPQPLAAAGAMLALIVIAATYDGLTDMSAERAQKLVMGNAIAPLAEFRPAVPRFTAFAASVPITAGEITRSRNDPRAIQTVLNRYRDAVSIQNVTAIRAVWPNANAETLRKEFAGRLEHNLDFDTCRIATTATGATASCAGVLESGFRAGDRRPRLERRRWQFTLRKFGDAWRITEVQTQVI